MIDSNVTWLNGLSRKASGYKFRVMMAVFLIVFGSGYGMINTSAMKRYWFLKYQNQRLQETIVYKQRQVLELSVYRDQLKMLDEKLKKNSAKVEHESLDALHFIGLVRDGAITWALISQPGGLVCTVMVGDYLGKERGRVVRIMEDGVEIEKTVRIRQGLEMKLITLSMRF